MYDNKGNIQFAFSDDDYIMKYLEKYNKFPFLDKGDNYLFLKSEPFPKGEMNRYKIESKKLILRNKDEIDKLIQKKKDNIKTETIYVKTL